ncbi:sulfurtransferase TusA family protein [Paraoerskovia marina]|uniref:Sulfurtransferase TusA n=1 Tax=Paraoerskovia marina TaxID=545619 RepID=A0A1H1S713_9CELL|nr:sulfurtransferase TusA family protein [Paraoerskovia marina]SDS43711.1 Sulfurtransferase TusA [Paraoerskovia marina]
MSALARTVDASGLRCPLPVIHLAKAARDVEDGTVITVLATDPAARHDVPAWARMRGHALVGETSSSVDDDGVETWTLSVRICATSPENDGGPAPRRGAGPPSGASIS